jgi:hypothetical protein
VNTIDVPIIGPSSNIPQDDAQRTLNFYAEKSGDTLTLKPTPGAVLTYTMIGGGPGRGALSLGGRLFGVKGSFFEEATVPTIKGTLGTNSGLISIVGVLPPAGSGQILVVDAANGYVYDFVADTFTTLTEATNGFVGGLSAVVCGGYGVAIKPGTNQVGFSELYDLTDWPGLNFFSTERTKGYLVALASTGTNLYLFTDSGFEIQTTEGYEGEFAFTLVSSGNQIGCQAPGSVQAFDGFVYWLGGNDAGKGVVYRHTMGGRPERISTHAIERLIAQETNPELAVGYCYQSLGHVFYVLTFAGKTLTYDADTKLWHERAWRNPVLGNLFPVPYVAAVIHEGVLLGLHGQNGSFFEVSNTVYTDNGAPIYRERIMPVIPEEADWMSYCGSLELFAETGNTPLTPDVATGFDADSPNPVLDTTNFLTNMVAATSVLNAVWDDTLSGSWPNPVLSTASFLAKMDEFLEGVSDVGGIGFDTTSPNPVYPSTQDFLTNLNAALQALATIYVDALRVETQVMLQYSTDRGMTWGQELWQQSGGNYSYSARTRWTGLGAAFGFVFKLAIVCNQFVSWRKVRLGME